jgi:hypothetical protein
MPIFRVKSVRSGQDSGMAAMRLAHPSTRAIKSRLFLLLRQSRETRRGGAALLRVRGARRPNSARTLG